MIRPFNIVVFLIIGLLTRSGLVMAQSTQDHREAIRIKLPKVSNFIRNQRVKLASLSGTVGQKMTTKLGNITQWAGSTRPGHVARRGKNKVDYTLLVSRGLMTRTADQLEMKLPRNLSKGFHNLRQANPFGFWGFCAHNFKQDPGFFMKYGIFSFAWSYLQPPALVSLGVSLPFAYSLTSSIVVPVDIAVILYRQHRRRQDPTQSIFGTLLGLGREYSQFAASRRFENRVFNDSWPRP